MMPGTWEAVLERERKEYHRNPGLREPWFNLDWVLVSVWCLQWKLPYLTFLVKSP